MELHSPGVVSHMHISENDLGSQYPNDRALASMRDRVGSWRLEAGRYLPDILFPAILDEVLVLRAVALVGGRERP